MLWTCDLYKRIALLYSNLSKTLCKCNASFHKVAVKHAKQTRITKWKALAGSGIWFRYPLLTTQTYYSLRHESGLTVDIYRSPAGDCRHIFCYRIFIYNMVFTRYVTVGFIWMCLLELWRRETRITKWKILVNSETRAYDFELGTNRPRGPIH